MRCKFYSEEIGQCLFDGPPDDCPFDNKEEECVCFRSIEENKKESKNMMKCKYYSEEVSKCLFDEAPDDCIFCDYFRLIEYEKESSPYSLNSTEINVFSKLFKEYIKDQDKLDKIVETFESYLSNASKSPANAEGKCSDEGTLYRIIKGRIENKEEPEVIKANLMTDKDTYIDRRTLTIQNCDKIILKPRSLEVEVKVEKDNFDDFDFISINGHKFKKV